MENREQKVTNYYVDTSQLALGIIVLGLTALFPAILYVLSYQNINEDRNRKMVEIERIKQGYEIRLYEKDLNKNGVNEKYIEINGKKYFLEIDGENLEKKLYGGKNGRTLD